MPLVTVSDGWYGPGTDRIRKILLRVQQLRWFMFVPDDNLRGRLVSLVERHLECLHRFNDEADLPNAPTVVLLDGDWDILHQERWGIDPHHAWGDRWKEADEFIGRCIRKLTTAVEANPDSRNLLRPPLWPVASQSNICGQVLIAHPAILNDLGNLKPGGRDWCVAWALLCKAEAHIWNTLLWELALGVGVVDSSNPFQSLLDLYELGAFPMGWVDNHYELYVPKTSKDAAATSNP